ncbi:MAG TPA: hypothetical protein VIK85_03905 [Coriobacteriia bacterium]
MAVFAFVFAMSVLFWLVESAPGTAGYTSYVEALQDILILALSGFDVAKPPVTPLGYGAAIAVLISGVIFVSIIRPTSPRASCASLSRRTRGRTR